MRDFIEVALKTARQKTDVNNAVEAINVDRFCSKQSSVEVLYLGHYQALQNTITLIDEKLTEYKELLSN
jgi:hypothetical protein